MMYQLIAVERDWPYLRTHAELDDLYPALDHRGLVAL